MLLGSSLFASAKIGVLSELAKHSEYFSGIFCVVYLESANGRAASRTERSILDNNKSGYGDEEISEDEGVNEDIHVYHCISA